jgi:catechol 2,3-dioxygenase-like lactoylglutathione lyase family enzyme
MELGHIELFVRDPDAARRFYVALLGGVVVAEQGDGRFLWVRIGERELLLREGNPGPATSSYDDAGVGLVLYSPVVDEDVARLTEAGVRCLPIDGEPGCFTLRDPDGHWWQIVDPSHPG